MLHSPVVHLLFKVAWIVTALSAINVGLYPFGYDFFMSEFFMNNLSRWGDIIYYIIGISGVMSMIGFVKKGVMHKGCCDGSGSCCK
ncbi:MAG TPA: hypothetical protein VEK38_01120 [Candidatus Bathyarchaeia archaeon]|nr:hypothetical protein [Candidatus Bathyarchaeia archaeon]